MDQFMGLLTEEEITKFAYTKVTNRASNWPKDVLDTLYAEFPSLLPYDARVSFRDQDESRGYGVGAIQVAGMAVPVIIKDFRLAPLDVALVQGTTVPLTKESIASFASQKSAFSQLQPIDPDRMLATFDPALESAAGAPIVNVTSGYEKSASILEKLSGYVTSEAKQKVLEMVRSPVIKKLAKNNEKATKSFAKLSKLKTADHIENIEDALNRKIERDMYYIYKTGQFKYNGIFGNSQIDSPVVIEKLEERSVKNLPMIHTCPGEPIVKKAEVEKGESDLGVAPSAGDYGMLKFADDTGTLPFMVENITMTDRSFVINGHDGFMPRNFYPLRGIEKEMPHEMDKNGSYVPLAAKFVCLDVDEQNNVKEAKNAEFTNRVERVDEIAYRMKGPQLAKYAIRHDPGNTWTIHDATWAVIATGGSENDIEKIAGLDVGHEYEIQTRLRLPVPLNKIAELVNTKITENSNILDTFNLDLVKLAAYMPTNESVDAVVGLNFLSKINIQEFVELLPMYEEVVSSLARLLIAIRMGMEKIPEEPVKTGMKEIMKVIYFLRGVKNLQKA